MVGEIFLMMCREPVGEEEKIHKPINVFSGG
jgi:hypothetical protein